MPFTESKKITRNQFLAISSLSLLFSFAFLIAGVISTPFYFIVTGAMLVSAVVAFAEYMRKREDAKPAPDLPPAPEAEPTPFVDSAEEEVHPTPAVAFGDDAPLEERIGGVEEPVPAEAEPRPAVKSTEELDAALAQEPLAGNASGPALRSSEELIVPPRPAPPVPAKDEPQEGVSEEPQSVVADAPIDADAIPTAASEEASGAPEDAPTHTTVVVITESENPAVPDEVEVIELDEKPEK